jgi:hypothetical protein
MNPSSGTAPTLGRIVHFNVSTETAAKLNQLGGKRYNVGEKVPAMITGLAEHNACYLTLFPALSDEMIAVPPVAFSTGNQPGTWNWPERIAETQQEAAA